MTQGFEQWVAKNTALVSMKIAEPSVRGWEKDIGARENLRRVAARTLAQAIIERGLLDSFKTMDGYLNFSLVVIKPEVYNGTAGQPETLADYSGLMQRCPG
jgi:hypothetical protein